MVAIDSVEMVYLAIDMCTSSLRALIVAYGWMLPRDVEMVFEYLAIDSGGYRQWWICVRAAFVH